MASAMKRAGYSLQDIAHIIGHKNLESLRYYLDKPTLQDKENFADDLFKYTAKDSESDMSDFEMPPPPKRKKDKTKTKRKPTATISRPNDSQLVAIQPNPNPDSNIQVPSSQNTQNIMQMYRQNPVGLFMGANITNCTINVNLPK